MRHFSSLSLCLALGLTLLTSCDAHRERSVQGTYRYTGDARFAVARKIEITPSKCIFTTLLGELASDYKVEDNYIYAQIEGKGLRLKIVSPDTLRLDFIMTDGVFVRQN